LNTDPAIIHGNHLKEFPFLKDSSIALQQVCLEITERSFVKNLALLSTYLKDMRAKGIKIAIDDVGEGYSSLNAIAELKPEFIKIDITLVRNIAADNIKLSIVRLIVDLAKRINSRLIAEGVETKQDCDALRGLGVGYGQGYLFMRPA
jgi:EAL domain-containing protein (putative c-di-GMP-specific phosphodiesterase class I)